MTDLANPGLLARERACGAWSMTAHPIILESLCRQDYDFVGLDLQHGSFGIADCFRGIQLASALSTPVAVRLNLADLAAVPRVLDHGATAVIIAMIESPEDALRAVAMTRYQPHGVRSYGGSRYGLAPEPRDPRQREPQVCVMIETAAAFDNVRAIARTPGLAGLFVGPVDLGLALDRPFPSFDDAQWQGAMREIATVGRQIGLRTATFATDGDTAARWLASGFDAVVIASDIALLSTAAAEALAAARGTKQPRSTHGY